MTIPRTESSSTMDYTVKSKLAGILKERGLTRMDVVRGADLTYQTVSKWINDEVSLIEPTTLGKLAKYLDVPECDLYELVEIDEE